MQKSFLMNDIVVTFLKSEVTMDVDGKEYKVVIVSDTKDKEDGYMKIYCFDKLVFTCRPPGGDYGIEIGGILYHLKIRGILK